MPVDKATSPISEYIGDGTANSFGMTFPAGSSEELSIYLRYVGDDALIAYSLPGSDPEGYPMQPLVEGIDYQLYNLNIPSVYGSLKLVDLGQQWLDGINLATDWNLIIRTSLDAFQSSSFRDLGVHAPINFEKALDHLTMVIKGLKYTMLDAVPAGDVIDTDGRGIKVWVSGATYYAGDYLVVGDNLYKCLTEHVAGATFLDDAAYWSMILDATKIFGGLIMNPVQSIAAGGKITLSDDTQQLVKVQGLAGAQVTDIVPFVAPPVDGTIITLLGQDNANFLMIPYSNGAGGCQIKGDCYLGLGDTLSLVYDGTSNTYWETARNN